MKNYILIFFLSTFSFTQIQAQSDIAKQKKFNAFLKEMPNKMESIREGMPKQEHDALFDHILETEFKLDTMYIEMILREEIDIYPSTLGMCFAFRHAEERYDSLLNVYYKKFLKKLTPTDRDVLKTTQRNWLKFRNSEYDLNALVREERYSDGGSIHKVFAAEKRCDITRQRVLELYSFYNRIWR